jgi:ferrous-iron efflux pump FieF
MTGSVALLTSAVSALVDVGASAVTIVDVRYAERPAIPSTGSVVEKPRQ